MESSFEGKSGEESFVIEQPDDEIDFIHREHRDATPVKIQLTVSLTVVEEASAAPPSPIPAQASALREHDSAFSTPLKQVRMMGPSRPSPSMAMSPFKLGAEEGSFCGEGLDDSELFFGSQISDKEMLKTNFIEAKSALAPLPELMFQRFSQQIEQEAEAERVRLDEEAAAAEAERIRIDEEKAAAEAEAERIRMAEVEAAEEEADAAKAEQLRLAQEEVEAAAEAERIRIAEEEAQEIHLTEEFPVDDTPVEDTVVEDISADEELALDEDAAAEEPSLGDADDAEPAAQEMQEMTDIPTSQQSEQEEEEAVSAKDQHIIAHHCAEVMSIVEAAATPSEEPATQPVAESEGAAEPSTLTDRIRMYKDKLERFRNQNARLMQEQQKQTEVSQRLASAPVKGPAAESTSTSDHLKRIEQQKNRIAELQQMRRKVEADHVSLLKKPHAVQISAAGEEGAPQFGESQIASSMRAAIEACKQSEIDAHQAELAVAKSLDKDPENALNAGSKSGEESAKTAATRSQIITPYQARNRGIKWSDDSGLRLDDSTDYMNSPHSDVETPPSIIRARALPPVPAVPTGKRGAAVRGRAGASFLPSSKHGSVGTRPTSASSRSSTLGHSRSTPMKSTGISRR